MNFITNTNLVRISKFPVLKKLIFLSFFVFLSFSLSAQESLRAMFYNVLNFPSGFPQDREFILKNIVEEIDPDILMICELESENGADRILSALNSINNEYARAPFFPSASQDFDHQQMIFFKRKKIKLQYSEAIATDVRDLNYYELKINTADSLTDPLIIHTFVTHLKSSQGNANKQLRLESVQKFFDRTENLPNDAFVIFAGDFNFYDHNEPGYQLLIDPSNTIPMVDPSNRVGSWHANRNFMDVHTQSTRVSSGGFGGGAGGGLDDRFDFIMISSNMENNPKLEYVPNSYAAYGNNGNCYKQNINDPSCSGVYSQVIREELYQMSDHTPVVMDIQTSKQIVLNTETYEVQQPFKLHKTILSDKLEIEVHPDYAASVTFSIYNILGQKVLEFNAENQSHVNFDVSALSSGVYYLKSNIEKVPALKFLKSS